MLCGLWQAHRHPVFLLGKLAWARVGWKRIPVTSRLLVSVVVAGNLSADRLWGPCRLGRLLSRRWVTR